MKKYRVQLKEWVDGSGFSYATDIDTIDERMTAAVGEAKLFTEKTEKDADVSPALGESSPSLSPSVIAKEAGVSVATVYNYAKTLGRLPTIEEARNWPRKKSGRKPKYT